MKGNIVVICTAILGIIISVAVCKYAMTPPDQRGRLVYKHDVQDSSYEQQSDYDIEFLSARVDRMESVMDMYDVILVTVRFTNNSDEPQSLGYAMSSKAFQNGVELKEFVNYDLMENSEELTEIKQGKSIDVVLPFELRDRSTPVDIELDEYIGDNKWAKTYEID